MDERKKKQLAKKGWQVGNAVDFLGLTPEEVDYVELQLKLIDQLKNIGNSADDQ